jgi:hypothetical protein
VSNLLDATFLNILVQTFKTKRSIRSFKKPTVISKNGGLPHICSIQPTNEKKNLTLLVFYYFSVFDETSHTLPADSVCPMYLHILK